MGFEEDEPEDALGLSTPRPTLRAPQRSDAAALADLADNPRVATQTARMPYPYRIADALEWIEEMRQAKPGASRSFVVLEGGCGGNILGAAGYACLDGEESELGYWIGERFWGRGFATEAAHKVIDDFFEHQTSASLLGRCRVGNQASRRVLEKCGFQYRGAGMIMSRALKGAVPTEDFTLDRSVWRSLKHWGGQ